MVVDCAVCLEASIKKSSPKCSQCQKAGVCKMYEQISQGVQLWLRLLQLGVSLVSRENHWTHRKCE